MLLWLLLLVLHEVWVYSEHSVNTKRLGKPGEAPRRGAGTGVAVYPVLGTQLDTEQEGQREGEVLDGYDKLVFWKWGG